MLFGLLQGSIDPTTAKAAGYLIQTDRKMAEGEDLERRLAALESALPQSIEVEEWPR